MKNHDSIQGLFRCLLNKMLLAEQEVREQLEVMCEASESGQLKEMFVNHMDETDQQVNRLEKALLLLEQPDEEPEGLLEKGKEFAKSITQTAFMTKSEALDGIIKEGKAIFKEFRKTKLHDLAISSGAQSIEMGEISAYRTLCLIATDCGYQEILKLLQQSLAEEEKTYQLMTDFTDKEIKKMKKAV